MAENGNGNGNGRWSALYRQIATWAVIGFIGLCTWAYTDLCAKNERKVDKDQYCRDISEIKSGINQIVQWHVQPDKGNK